MVPYDFRSIFFSGSVMNVLLFVRGYIEAIDHLRYCGYFRDISSSSL